MGTRPQGTETGSGRAPGNVAEMTVGELSDRVRTTVQEAYGLIRVRGELGRVTRAASGHVYADLKDDRAVLSLVMWRSQAARLAFEPEQGMEVVAEGRLSTYPGRSAYQLITDSLRAAGDGALLLQLEARRRALAAEGLFDGDRKCALPFCPRTIGVVTSPTGAVLQDILHRVRDRFPCRVLLWPCRVQGREAADEIAAAIRGFSALPQDGAVPVPELVIVARGGGSIEDLWAFNEERVVRAVADSPIPLISAVGHETDTTLIDFAADVRAPTPTAAAELAVPLRADLSIRLENASARAGNAAADAVARARSGLQIAAARLPLRDALLQDVRQRLDLASARLPSADALLRPARQRLDIASARGARAIGPLLERHKGRLQELSRVLHSVSPSAVLGRGYAIVSDEWGVIARKAKEVAPGQKLSIRFKDGAIGAVAEAGQ